MTAFAIAVPFEHEQRLVADAARYGHSVVARCSGADELAARVVALRPDVVLVTAEPQYLNARLVAGCDSAGLRLVVMASGPEQHRLARSLGVVDALDGFPSWHALTPDAGSFPSDAQAGPSSSGPSAFGPAPSVSVPSPAPPVAARARGRVITVWGPAGAPGRTSLAIAIAAELAEAGVSVALADADTHAASIDPALGLLDEAPGFAAACRLAGAGSLTNSEFERIAEWTPSGRGGFWVLTGLGRPSRWPELTAERVNGVIDAARGWVDVLVVDTASSLEQDEELSSDVATPRRNAATMAALRGADQVVAVASADPIGLTRYLRAHAEVIDTAAPDRIITVVNKVRASAIGLNPQAQITQTLSRFGGVAQPVLIPWDPPAFDAALLGGKALRDAAPRSPASAAVRALVLERLLPASTPQRRRRLAGRRERARRTRASSLEA